jgi:L-fucose mutarotase
MLLGTLIHPQISSILAAAGHHATVLIADGHYPASTKKGPHAQVVSLNLSPGVVRCAQVLEAILAAVPVDRIQTMMYETGGPYGLTAEPAVWSAYRDIIARLKNGTFTRRSPVPTMC